MDRSSGVPELGVGVSGGERDEHAVRMRVLEQLQLDRRGDGEIVISRQRNGDGAGGGGAAGIRRGVREGVLEVLEVLSVRVCRWDVHHVAAERGDHVTPAAPIGWAR